MSDNSNLSYLLQLLMDTAKKNSSREKHGNRYNEDLKLFSVYLFIVAGRFIYEWLYENLKPALPSLSQVERTLANSSEPVKEGKFRFSELSEFLNVNNLPRKVFIAEDGTRIVQKFVYDLTSDQIIGCSPPLADNGVPVTNSFPASSAALIAMHFEKAIPSSSAYAIMVQPAEDGAPTFCLSMFGTDNKFTTEHVFKRWHYIYDELSKLDIECLGFSADGDPKVLNAMHSVMFSPGAPCPKEFKDFFFASGELRFVVMQDYIHTVNKFRNRLSPSHYLPLGKYSASQSHLIILMDTLSKEEHGLTPAVMAKDKMNFNASIKICSERVTSLMEEHIPGSEGTVAYLNVMRHVMEAGLNKSLSPLEIIYKIWYATFFIRYWKNWLISNPKFTLDNFVSRNLYICVEIIAHSITILIVKSRSQKECQLIHLFSSQTCESIFRLLRSMTSTESTVINFSMKEILQKVRRVDMLHHVTSKLEGKIEFPREERKRLLKALSEEQLHLTHLPSNAEIRTSILQAKDDAIKVLRKLGVTCPQDLSTKIKTSLLSCRDFESDESLNTFCGYEADVNEEDIPLNLLAAFPSPDSVSDLDLQRVTNERFSRSHVIVPDKSGGFKTISKSLLCWLLSSCGSTTLSTARIFRVRDKILSSLGAARPNPTLDQVCKKDAVGIGNWCIFKEKTRFFVTQVTDFKYLSGDNKTYSLLDAPVQPPKKTEARGIGCLGIWYTVHNGNILKLRATQHNIFKIEQYVCTIPSPLPDVSGNLQLSPNAAAYFSKL